ncbi:MAG: OsmC family protein [Cyclobacteriaceae bacterium]
MSKKIVTCKLGDQDYLTQVQGNHHSFFLDEPKELGGSDQAANPTQHLLGSLVACTAITIKMYSKRKGWDTGEIRVSAELKEALKPDGVRHRIVKEIEFGNELDQSQVERLLLIAEKCPVSKLLQKPIESVMNQGIGTSDS